MDRDGYVFWTDPVDDSHCGHEKKPTRKVRDGLGYIVLNSSPELPRAEVCYAGGLRPALNTNDTIDRMTKTTNRTQAIQAAAPITCVAPRIAAMRAMIKNVNAQPNIMNSF